MRCCKRQSLETATTWDTRAVRGSEADERHRDDVRLRWMQGPWSVWQMPILNRCASSSRRVQAHPVPRFANHPPPAPSLQAQGATCNRFAAGCGLASSSPSLGTWHLALFLLHRGCWAAVDALPPSAARRRGSELVAKRDCDSTLPFAQIHPVISQGARPWWCPNTQRDGRQGLSLDSKFELYLC